MPMTDKSFQQDVIRIGERFVPGAFIETGEHKIRLRPPDDWPCCILEIPRTPPSFNRNAASSRWTFRAQKLSWQEEIETLLMVEKVSRQGYRRAIAGCFMRFPKRARRDAPNFAHIVNKALGDALVTYRAIADDDPSHYVFGGVEFEEERGPNRTQIVLFFQPQQEES